MALAADVALLRTEDGLLLQPLDGSAARRVLAIDTPGAIRASDWNGSRTLYVLDECDGRRTAWSDDGAARGERERGECPASIVSRRLRLRRRSVVVRVRCPAGCRGFMSLTIRRRGVALGRSFAVPRGRTRGVRLVLHRGGLRTLARNRGRARLAITVPYRAGVDQVFAKTVTIR